MSRSSVVLVLMSALLIACPEDDIPCEVPVAADYYVGTPQLLSIQGGLATWEVDVDHIGGRAIGALWVDGEPAVRSTPAWKFTLPVARTGPVTAEVVDACTEEPVPLARLNLDPTRTVLTPGLMELLVGTTSATSVIPVIRAGTPAAATLVVSGDPAPRAVEIKAPTAVLLRTTTAAAAPTLKEICVAAANGTCTLSFVLQAPDGVLTLSVVDGTASRTFTVYVAVEPQSGAVASGAGLPWTTNIQAGTGARLVGCGMIADPGVGWTIGTHTATGSGSTPPLSATSVVVSVPPAGEGGSAILWCTDDLGQTAQWTVAVPAEPVTPVTPSVDTLWIDGLPVTTSAVVRAGQPHELVFGGAGWSSSTLTVHTDGPGVLSFGPTTAAPSVEPTYTTDPIDARSDGVVLHDAQDETLILTAAVGPAARSWRVDVAGPPTLTPRSAAPLGAGEAWVADLRAGTGTSVTSCTLTTSDPSLLWSVDLVGQTSSGTLTGPWTEATITVASPAGAGSLSWISCVDALGSTSPVEGITLVAEEPTPPPVPGALTLEAQPDVIPVGGTSQILLTATDGSPVTVVTDGDGFASAGGSPLLVVPTAVGDHFEWPITLEGHLPGEHLVVAWSDSADPATVQVAVAAPPAFTDGLEELAASATTRWTVTAGTRSLIQYCTASSSDSGFAVTLGGVSLFGGLVTVDQPTADIEVAAPSGLVVPQSVALTCADPLGQATMQVVIALP